MAFTSIKVSKDVRDRLRVLAQHRDMSQSAFLEQLLREAEEAAFWDQMAQDGPDEYRRKIRHDGDTLGEDYSLEEAMLREDEA